MVRLAGTALRGGEFLTLHAIFNLSFLSLYFLFLSFGLLWYLPSLSLSLSSSFSLAATSEETSSSEVPASSPGLLFFSSNSRRPFNYFRSG